MTTGPVEGIFLEIFHADDTNLYAETKSPSNCMKVDDSFNRYLLKFNNGVQM